MKIFNNSGPAIFMYIVIGLSIIIATVCFTVYYTNMYNSMDWGNRFYNNVSFLDENYYGKCF